MAKIIGNITATPSPKPDWAQMDPAKADFIKNKPSLTNGEGENSLVQIALVKGDSVNTIRIPYDSSTWEDISLITFDNYWRYVGNQLEISSSNYVGVPFEVYSTGEYVITINTDNIAGDVSYSTILLNDTELGTISGYPWAEDMPKEYSFTCNVTDTSNVLKFQNSNLFYVVDITITPKTSTITIPAALSTWNDVSFTDGSDGYSVYGNTLELSDYRDVGIPFEVSSAGEYTITINTDNYVGDVCHATILLNDIELGTIGGGQWTEEDSQENSFTCTITDTSNILKFQNTYLFYVVNVRITPSGENSKPLFVNINTSKGNHSTALGYGAQASYDNQTVLGTYNNPVDGLLVVGNGTSDTDRKNAFTVNKDNSITIGSTTLTESQIQSMLAGGDTSVLVDTRENFEANNPIIPEGQIVVIKESVELDDEPKINISTKIGEGVSFEDTDYIANLKAGTGYGSIVQADAINEKDAKNGKSSAQTGHSVVNVASGENAVAFGKYNVASGKTAMVFGYDSEASGHRAIATGANTIASGGHSFTAGGNTEAIGRSSVAMGWHARASGTSSFALGEEITARGDYSFTTGVNNSADGRWAIAGGTNSAAMIPCSLALGYYTHTGDAKGLDPLVPYPQAVFGKHNVPSNTAAFQIGWGDAANKKNIFEIDFDESGNPVYNFGDTSFSEAELIKLKNLLNITNGEEVAY